MDDNEKLDSHLSRFGRRSYWVFTCMVILIVGLFYINWEILLKPRLRDEAIANIQLIAASRALSLEAQFQNFRQKDYFPVIQNSIHELLLFTDEHTGEAMFLGIELEVDEDALGIEPGDYRMDVGMTQCQQCIVSEHPLYNRASGELVAIFRIHANPIFYQNLVADIRDQLLQVLVFVLAILTVAWFITNRLLLQLRNREKSLTLEISERKMVERQLHQIATYDQLTHLPNRYQLHKEFNKKLEEAKRSDKVLALLFFDLDRFKTINDMYGHETGDLLLQETADRISSLIRSYDLLARFGGDEFVMIMPNLDNPSAIFPVVEKIIASFKQEFKLGEVSVHASTSIGISVYPQDGLDSSTLLKNADLAMYQAKAEGRNCYHFFTPGMNEELERSHWIEVNLKKAIEQHGLELYFQPQVNVVTEEVESCEALLRWPQADGTNLPPSEFIPVAERSGLMNQVSKWVFTRAWYYQQLWSETSKRRIRIDINVSGKDFSDISMQILLNDYLENQQTENPIGLEITENVLLKATPEIQDNIGKLKNSGMVFSLDDFGTGYSSLNYLKNFPVSFLKIDQSFVLNAPNDDYDRRIIQAIISVGHGLGMQVVAEGVETEDHLNLIKQAGCDLAQGYYFDRPLPAEEFFTKYLSR